MKKIVFLCGIALVLTLVSGPVYALSFGFDMDGDGVPDDTEIAIYESDTVEIDIYLVGYNITTNCFGVDWYFRWNTSSLDLQSYSYDDTVWEDATFYEFGNDELFITQFQSPPGIPGPTIKLASVVLHCKAAPSTDWIKATLSPDGLVADVNGGTHPCDDGDGNIIQLGGEPVECTSNADCGTDGYINGDYCYEGDVYRDYRTYTCNNPGTQDAYCSHEDTGVKQEDCDYGCEDGVCLPEGGCRVTLEVEDITAHQGEASIQVPVSMENQSDEVLAIETLLLDDNNCLTCTGCTADPDRASEFMCFAYEQLSGGCKVIMVNLSSDGLPSIAKGDGTVFTVDYTSNCDADDCGGCITIAPVEEDTIIADVCEDPVVPVCVKSGEICFITCGDVYPPGDDCGDGSINIFDILEEIDIVLGIIVPTECQVEQGDVPTGNPTCDDCSPPDGVINIFDILVIIDKALDKDNCCDYYYFGD